MSKAEGYKTPEVLGDFSVTEPVETGCCLRSCGGSPSHMGPKALVSAETEAKFEEVSRG